MPYIALQLVGIQVVLQVMGIGGGEDAWLIEKDLPLFVAFAILAAYTYTSGLRAPALIAFVKDTLIYLVILVAVIYLPIKLGGWGNIFDAARPRSTRQRGARGARPAVVPGEAAVLGVRDAGAGVGVRAVHVPALDHGRALDAQPQRDPAQRVAAAGVLFLLGLLALLGYVAIAAGSASTNAQQAIPQLFENEFPSWFAGVAFAAIGIGALVPAAIMSIAAANLWTRNIYKAFLNPDATPAQEAQQAKLVSLVVKVGALVVRAVPADTSSR